MIIIKCVTKDNRVFYTCSVWAAEHDENVISCREMEIDDGDTICNILNDFEERFRELRKDTDELREDLENHVHRSCIGD